MQHHQQVASFTWENPARREVKQESQVEPDQDAKQETNQKTDQVRGALCGDLISGELQCLECDLEVAKGLEALDSAGVTSAPVVDDNGVLVGVVFLATLARMRQASELEVEDAMVTDMVTAPLRATVAEVARLMATHHLERLPVVSSDGHLVGVVSAMDVVRWLADHLP